MKTPPFSHEFSLRDFLENRSSCPPPSQRFARVERTLLSAALSSCRQKDGRAEIESQRTARRTEQPGDFQPCGSTRPARQAPQQTFDEAPAQVPPVRRT